MSVISDPLEQLAEHTRTLAGSRAALDPEIFAPIEPALMPARPDQTQAERDASMFDLMRATKQRAADVKAAYAKGQTVNLDGKALTVDEAVAHFSGPAKAQLSSYATERTATGGRVFQFLEDGLRQRESKRWRENLPMLTQLFSGPATMADKMPQADRAAFEDSFKLSLDPDRDKMVAANMRLVAEMTGKTVDEISPAWDAVRSKYAQQAFGLSGVVDDATFYQAAGKALTKEKTDGELLAKIHARASVLALQGKPLAESLAEAKKLVGDRLPEFAPAVRQGHASALARFSDEEIKIADTLWNAFGRMSKDLKTETGKESPDMETALQGYGNLSQKNRDNILGVIALRAQDEGEDVKNYFARLAAGHKSGVFRLVSSVFAGAEGSFQDRAQRMLDAGTIIEGADVKDLVFAGGQDQLTDLSGMTGIEPPKKRPLTAEEKSYLKSQVNFHKGARAFLTDLPGAGIKAKRYLQENAEGLDQYLNWSVMAAESLPYMAAAVVPYGGGLLLNAAAYGEQNLSTLRKENPGMDNATMERTAYTSGLLMAGVDRLQINLMGAKLPKLQAWAFRQKKLLSVPGIFAARVGTFGAAEFGQEIVQDMTLPAMSELVSVLSDEIQGPNWKEVIAKEKAALGDIAGVSLLFGIIGGAGRAIGDVVSLPKLKEMLTDRQGLAVAGFTPETIEAVATEAETNPLAAAEALKAAAIETPADVRKANSKAAVEAQKANPPPTAQEAALPEIIQGEDGNITVKYPDGTEDVATSMDDAFAALRVWEQDDSNIQEQGIRGLLKFFEGYHEGNAELGVKGIYTGKEISFADWAKGSSERLAQAYHRVRIWMLNEFTAGRAKTDGSEIADADIDLSQFLIFGSSQNTFAAGVTRIAIQVANAQQGTKRAGATVLTPIEEHAEGVFKWMMDSGKKSEAWFIQQIREVEANTKAGQPMAANLMELSPELRRQEVIEALSRLAVANATGKVQDSQLSAGIKAIFRALKETFKAILELAADIAAFRQSGKMDSEFAYWLDVAGGMSEDYYGENMVRQMEADMIAESMEGMPEIKSAIAGKLPHPETLRANGHPLAGEVFALYDEIKQSEESGANQSARTRKANEFFLPPGEMVDLDKVRESLNQQGFDFQTPADMLYAAMLSVGYRKPQYAIASTGMESFSIGNINFSPGGGSKEVTIQDTTIDFGISSDGKTGEIILVKTPRNKRRQGSATAALSEFIRQADRNGLTLFLTPEPMDKGVTKSGLEDLYKSLGFRPNKGQKKDFRSMASMVRDPQRESGESFSIGRATVTPTAEKLGEILFDKIGAEALTLEQPKAKYEDKRQLLLDFSAAVFTGTQADTKAESGNRGQSENGSDSTRRRLGLQILREKHAGEIAENLKVDFLGATIGSSTELAVHAQSLRNPKFETFYILAAQHRTKRHKGGAGLKIVDAMAVTGRIPCSAAIFADGKGWDEGIAGHLEFLKAAKADAYFLMHNHPSGDPAPSAADLRITQKHAAAMFKEGINFIDHIVINHSTFSQIASDGTVQTGTIPRSDLKETFDPYGWPSRLIDKVVEIGQDGGSPHALIERAREIEADRTNENSIFGFILNARLRVVASLVGSYDDFKNLTVEKVADYARDQGGIHLMLHARAADKTAAISLISRLHALNYEKIAGELVVSIDGGADYVSAREESYWKGIPSFFGLDVGNNGVRVQESFSIGRATVTPTSETRTFQGTGGETVVGPASFSIGAWHGTPHKVDRFTTEKIGTGEGAQAYGWGLYFAEVKEVGSGYMKAGRSLGIIKDSDGKWFTTDGPKTIAGPFDSSTQAQQIADSETGNLYRVNLKVEDEDLLDWDKPLSEQSENVRAAIKSVEEKLRQREKASYDKGNQTDPALWGDIGKLNIQPGPFTFDPSGKALYTSIEGIISSEEASSKLRALGIRGIRYLDGNSRSGGIRAYQEGLPQGWEYFKTESGWGIKNEKGLIETDVGSTKEQAHRHLFGEKPFYNYVIFNESDIEILEENGTPVVKSGESFSIGLRTSKPGAFPANLADVVKSTSVSGLTGASLKPGESLVPLDETKVKPTMVSPDYKAAKKDGDEAAALRVVLHRLKLDQVLADLKSRIDPTRPVILLPIMHRDTGKRANALPMAYADELANATGWDVSEDIVKVSGAANTGASGKARAMNDQAFDGPVDTGAQYILVDDTFTGGGTLIAAYEHITGAGGTVSAMTTLAAGRYQNYLQHRPQDVEKLLAKTGLTRETFAREIGFPIEQLTGSEVYRFAQVGKGIDSGASLRSRILEDGSEADSEGSSSGAGETGTSQVSHSIGRADSPLIQAIDALVVAPEVKAEVFKRMAAKVRDIRQRFDRKRLTSPLTDLLDDDPNARFESLKDLATLEAVAKVLPPAIRGKLVGSFRAVNALKTAKGREDYMIRLLPKIEQALETHLQNQFRMAIRREFDRGASKVSEAKTRGGKIGAVAHAIFEEARAAMKLKPEQAEATAEKYQTELETADSLTPERLEELDGKIAALQLFNDFENADSMRLEEALTLLRDVYRDGRREWLEVLGARRELRLGRIDALKKGLALDRPIDAADRAHSRRADEGTLKKLDEGFMEFMTSNSQKIRRLAELTGDAASVAVVEEFEGAVLDAELAEGDMNHADQQALAAAMRRIFKVNSEWGVAAKLAELTRAKDHAPVTKLEGSKSETITVPKNLVESLIRGEVSGFTNPDGTAVELDAYDVAALEEAWDRFSEMEEADQNRRRLVHFTRRVSGGVRRSLGPVSQLEGLQLWLTMRQPDQGTKMEALGYDPETMAELEAWLLPETKAIGMWMVDYLKADQGTLDGIHRAEKGVGLGLVENYFPIRNDVSGSDNTGMGLDGNPQMQGGRSVSSLKERVTNYAPPALANAIGVFLNTRGQVNFWKAHVSTMREWGGVLRDDGMAAAIKVRMGETYFQSLKRMMERIESGGSLAKGTAGMERWMKQIMKTNALGVLGMRASTIWINFTAALNVMWEIRADKLIKGMLQVMKRPEAFKDAWNSPAIRRRMEQGATFEAQIAKASGPSSHPLMAILNRTAERGMLPIQLADTGANLLGAAVVWESTRADAVAAGMDDATARTMADAKVERVLMRAAQPTTRIAKSEFEQRILDFPLAAPLALFISEPRKNLALTYMALRELATGKGTAGKAMAAQQAALGLVGIAAAEYVMRSLFQAFAKAKDDEEDDIFDRFWNKMGDWKGWANQFATSHLKSVPVIGDAWAMLMAKTFGQPVFNKNPNPMVDVVATGPGNAADAFGDVSPEERAKAIIKLTQQLGRVVPGGAVFAQGGNVAEFGMNAGTSNGVAFSDEDRARRIKARYQAASKALDEKLGKTTGADGKINKDIQAAKHLALADKLRAELAPLDEKTRAAVLKEKIAPDAVTKASGFPTGE